MTLESTLSKKIYKGNGLTRHFPIPFFVAEALHIFLILKDENGSRPITTNFNVNLDDKTVQYPSVGEPLSSSEELTIYRKLPLNQVVDLENAGAFHPKVLELDGFDRVVMQIQQLDEVLTRSIKVDINSEQTPSELLKDIFDAKDTAIEKAQSASESAAAAAISAAEAHVSELAAKESEENALDSADTAEFWAIADITENEEGSSKYWSIQASQAVPDAMETVKGKAALATEEEVIAGIVENKIVTPKGFSVACLDYLSKHNADANTHAPLLEMHNEDINAHEGLVKSLDFGDIDFFNRQIPPRGYAVANGSVLKYANIIYPKLWEFLQKEENAWRIKTEEEWQALIHEDGVGGANAFVLDTMANTLRLPDIRGYYMGGAGWNEKVVGDCDGDAIRNLQGTISFSFPISGNIASSGSGVFSNKTGKVIISSMGNVTWWTNYSADPFFDASLTVPTDTRNHPATVYMLPCVFVGVPVVVNPVAPIMPIEV